jgi:hypothetical protein
LSDPLWDADRAKRSAQTVAQAIRNTSGLKLDYSEPSVILLEESIGREWGSDPHGMSDQIVDGIGCYVGELMVRHLGAEWAPGTAEPIVNFEGGDVPVVTRTREALAAGGDHPVSMMYARIRAGVTQGMLRPVRKGRGAFWRR